MTDKPIFRLQQLEEAIHHAEISCKQEGFAKGDEGYKECFDENFDEYMYDLASSLFPSAELHEKAKKNKQKSNPTSKKSKEKIETELRGRRIIVAAALSELLLEFSNLSFKKASVREKFISSFFSVTESLFFRK